MKHIKLFEEFVNEAIKFPTVTLKAWHTSITPIKKLGKTPMWFTQKIEWAKEYHANAAENVPGSGYTYEVRLKGIILTKEQAREWAENNGINHDERVENLVGNPDPDEVNEWAKEYMKVCDGMAHWDYDPTDWGDGESILIFNPAKTVKIIKVIKI